MATKAFPDKTTGEIKLCVFDFAAEQATGSVLSAPQVTKELVDGDDTSAVLLTVGTPVVAGSTVKVLIGGGKEANKYRLIAQVDADNGERHQLAGTMKTKASAA